MTQKTLMVTCRHNLLTSVLIQLEVAEYRTWRQLLEQGQQVKVCLQRQKAEDI